MAEAFTGLGIIGIVIGPLFALLPLLLMVVMVIELVKISRELDFLNKQVKYYAEKFGSQAGMRTL